MRGHYGRLQAKQIEYEDISRANMYLRQQVAQLQEILVGKDETIRRYEDELAAAQNLLLSTVEGSASQQVTQSINRLPRKKAAPRASS